MALLKDIIQWCDQTLKSHEFKDYAPNGLQIEGRSEVKKFCVQSRRHKVQLMQRLHNKQICSWFIMAISGKVNPIQSQVCVANESKH